MFNFILYYVFRLVSYFFDTTVFGTNCNSSVHYFAVRQIQTHVYCKHKHWDKKSGYYLSLRNFFMEGNVFTADLDSEYESDNSDSDVVICAFEPVPKLECLTQVIKMITHNHSTIK